MKCYNHSESDAIGICKNCNKGICLNCVTELKNGLACTATCIDEVNQINLLIHKGKLSYSTAAAAYFRSAYLSGMMGLLFLFFGLRSEGILNFLTCIGPIFLIAAAFGFIAAKKYKKNAD
jgi:hypothetical protein